MYLKLSDNEQMTLPDYLIANNNSFVHRRSMFNYS